MLFQKLDYFRSIERFLGKNPSLKKACGIKKIPSYRTLGRRLPEIVKLVYPLTVKLLVFLTETGFVSWRLASIDSSLLKAFGKEEQREWIDGKPKGGIWQKPTDKEARWGYSAGKDEWIFGYKIHLIVLVKPLIVPLCWLSTSASPHDSNFFKPLSVIAQRIAFSLSQLIKVFLGDTGYDSLENRDHALFLNNARLVAPIKQTKGKMSGRRRIIDDFNHSPQGKGLLKRRGDIERFFYHFKNLFNVDPLPVIGKTKVEAYLTLACFGYLAAVCYNIRMGRKPREIKSLFF